MYGFVICCCLSLYCTCDYISMHNLFASLQLLLIYVGTLLKGTTSQALQDFKLLGTGPFNFITAFSRLFYPQRQIVCFLGGSYNPFMPLDNLLKQFQLTTLL